MKAKDTATGFTLLEILLAMLIFAVVITTVFGSYGAVFFNAGDMDQDVKVHEMAQTCLDRMIQDLYAIYVPVPPEFKPPGINDPPSVYQIAGESVLLQNAAYATLRFTALAHLPLEETGRDGIAEIRYYVQPTADGQVVLRRSDALYPFGSFVEKGSDPILCRQVRSLKFIYYDREGNEFDHWNSDSGDFQFATPRAIRIRLELENSPQAVTLETLVTLPVFREKIG